MNRKWTILLVLVLSLSLLAGCETSPQVETQPPVDGQAQDVVAVKGSDFAVDEEGNTYYSRDKKMVRRDINGNEEELTDRCLSIIIKDDWIYYMDYGNRIFKMSKDGDSKQLLTNSDTCGDMMLIGDSIYFANGDYDWSIFKMDTNGENVQEINNYNCNRFVGFKDDWLYYIRYNYEYDKNKETKTMSTLYKMRADGSEVTLISDYNTVEISIEGDSIYHLIQNLDGYADDIYRTDLDGGDLTQLHILPQSGGNYYYEMAVKDGWIYYYSSYDGSDLHKVRTDGTGDEVIFKGLVMDLELSGDWLFCFDQETEYWYKMKPDGTDKEQLYPDSMLEPGPAFPEG